MSTVDDKSIKAQWDAFNKVLFWINEQEEKYISKGELYDAVMEMRPNERKESENI